MTWMPRETVPAEPRCSTTWPATSMVPLSGRSTPETTLMRVDFPLPFSPMRQWISPARTSKSTPLSAWTPTKLFWMARRRRKSSIAGASREAPGGRGGRPGASHGIECSTAQNPWYWSTFSLVTMRGRS